MLKKVTTSIFFLFLIIIFLMVSGCKEMSAFECYAIKYGESKYPSKFIFYNDKLNQELPFDWLFYLIKIKDKLILIDTGFSGVSIAKQYGFTYYEEPVDLLKKVNIDSQNITDIIITHSHFDHIGSIDKFTSANIYIQKQELEWFLSHTHNIKLANFLEKNKKLITFDESIDVLDFLHLKKIGGHTIGSSIVSFTYNNKDYIITGDECYLFDNYLNQEPVGTVYDVEKNKTYIKSLSTLTNTKIFTFHEPKICKGKSFLCKITE